jgi:hypothetical protein
MMREEFGMQELRQLAVEREEQLTFTMGPGAV